MITTLLLDVDGVLQFPRRPEFVDALERDHAWRDGYLAFQAELFADPEYLATLSGRADVLAVTDRLLARHAPSLTGRAFMDRWLAEDIVLNGELIAQVGELTVERVYLATNQEPIRGAHVERLHAHPWLTGVFASWQLGRAKPDPAYFERLLDATGLPAAECLFVDDKEPLVAAARGVGLHAAHYTSNDLLLAEFRRYGLASAGEAPDQR
ncbi:HAD family hydrolase [Longispora fulva]|uniref:Putative hydrolase of the HAD superfamily n=1 Tax=Longispora fulva TaxID=619741 RepID=A0A8J7GEY0_9ACTN|nr:HAD-IA family hydrolase [Longispora fulva]MBG6136496.1 putative hydrolase of the HAD superfamily [Longispora fulva]